MLKTQLVLPSPPGEAELAAARSSIVETLPFLYSTPSYWPSLEHLGWLDVGKKLHELSRAGKWAEMAGEITDEVFEALVPNGTYDVIADRLIADYGALAQRITFPLPEDPANDAAAAEVVRALQATGQI